jgi:hypothetical protein
MEEARWHSEARSVGEYALQLIGFLGAPTVWALEFIISYAITQHACATGKYWELYLLSLVSCLLATGATFIAFRNLGLTSEKQSSDGGTPLDRTRFMAITGLMISAFFVVVIVAEAVPRFILSPCE